MIKLNDRFFPIKEFRDGTQKLRALPENDVEGRRFTITWLYGNDKELFTLYCLTRYLQENDAAHITLKMPYVPNARMDRTEKDGDVHTLRYFAELINSLHFNRVEVFDPHSDVTRGCLNNVHVISPIETIQRIINRLSYASEPILYYPDRGAKNRYQDRFPRMQYLFGEKRRNWETSQISKLEICGDKSLVRDANILMIDDICSSGNTLLLSARELKELGAKDIYIYVSHCENGVPESELVQSGLITKFYTTNSVFDSSRISESALSSDGKTVVELPTTTFHIFDLF